uniref:Kelch repeat-containing protein kel-10 n=1 Tax=Schistocephalus solidus TaxID=70667 RepID=A0A0X3Q449_SCHSO
MRDLNYSPPRILCISTTALARWMQQQPTSTANVKSASQESIGEDGGTVGGSRGEWRLLASLQQARSCAAAALIDGARVVVLGGQSSGKPLSSVEVYEAERNQWFYLPQMLEARTQLCSATVPSRNLVLAVGGISSAAGGAFFTSPQPTFESDFQGLSVSAEAFDYRCPRWFRLPEPIRRGSLIGGTLVPLPSSSGRVMLIGGSDGHSALTQTQIFDLRAWTWLPGPSLAVGRFSPSAVFLPSSGPGIAVIGGYNVAAGGFLNSVEVVSMSDCASPACISPWASVSLCPPTELLPDAAASVLTSSTSNSLSLCPTLV